MNAKLNKYESLFEFETTWNVSCEPLWFVQNVGNDGAEESVNDQEQVVEQAEQLKDPETATATAPAVGRNTNRAPICRISEAFLSDDEEHPKAKATNKVSKTKHFLCSDWKK